MRKEEIKDYVLDEFKSVLFPKKKNKYEEAHLKAMERQKLED